MSSKECGFRIRVDKELRTEFVELCRAQDRTAAQVLREFMRRYVEEHSNNLQPDMFGGARKDLVQRTYWVNDGE